MDVEKLVGAFINIRNARSQLSAEFKQEDAKLKEQAETIKASLMYHLDKHNQKSARTNAGTFFKTLKTNYWSNDWPAVKKFIVARNEPELLINKFNQTNLVKFMEDNPKVDIPGLQADSEYNVNVRKA